MSLIRKFTLLPFMLLTVVACAQDSLTAQRRSNHYVGVQANQLMRQIINFGGSTGSVNNPYLITYAVNSRTSGWGLNVGLGYTHEKIRNEDPFNPLETTIDDLFFRMGVERKVAIGEKWITSYGLDILRESEKNITENGSSQPNDFKTDTRNRGTGMGLRFTLNYYISEKILLGTESTYYYKWMNESREGTNIPDETENSKEFTFTVPITLFLMLEL